jgi:uncharacterized membrane protein
MMKKIISNSKFFAAMAMFVSVLTACNKNNSYIDTVYPDQSLYLAQAAVATVGPGANGIYSLTPNIPNQPQRFSIDVTNGKFNIPLGIIKAGVSTDGAYTIGINANADTINKLIAGGKFAVPSDPAVTTELLPATAYMLPPSVDITNGSVNATFNVSVDLAFLTNSFNATPKKRYAIAITISNSAKSAVVKTALATSVILIDTRQVIPPMPSFSSYVAKDSRTAVFTNTTSNGVSYSWNYGDGSALETTLSPSHLYAAAGTYTVTLTATGIAGSGASVVKTGTVVIP